MNLHSSPAQHCRRGGQGRVFGYAHALAAGLVCMLLNTWVHGQETERRAPAPVIRISQLPESSPELAEPLASESIPAPDSGKLLDLKSIREISIDITPPVEENGNGRLPSDPSQAAFGQLPTVQPPFGSYYLAHAYVIHRPTGEVAHRPLYFEDVNLERHGTSIGQLQPVLSAARFFATIPAMPYLVTAEHPDVCMLSRDPFEAGRPAPWVCSLPPLDPVAGVAQAGLITGLIFLIP